MLQINTHRKSLWEKPHWLVNRELAGGEGLPRAATTKLNQGGTQLNTNNGAAVAVATQNHYGQHPSSGQHQTPI